VYSLRRVGDSPGGASPSAAILAGGALYYTVLLLFGARASTGTFSLLATVDNGMAFNSMLAHLLHGQFDVDPAAIGSEGFEHDGKSYSYFGIFVALLRLPLVIFNALGTVDVTVLSCVVAVVVLTGCQLAAIRLVDRALPPSGLQRLLAETFVVVTLLAGPSIAFLKPSIYQEVVLWANACAAAFVCCAVYGVFISRHFSVHLLTLMALLAGLCLHIRVSTAIGLYAVTTLLAARQAWLGLGDRIDRPALRLLLPLAVLALFAGGAGVVNYQRWGNPLTFADLHLHVSYLHIYPDRLLVLANHGEFNPARIGFGLLYYLLPVWAVRMPDGGFLFDDFQGRFLDAVELPPASLLLSDPFLVGLAALGMVLAWRRRRRLGVDSAAVGLIAAGLTAPVLLILMAMSMTFRYRGEFYPLLEFFACTGFFLACASPTPKRATPSPALRRLVLAGCVVSVLGSHLSLALYDLSPFGSARDILPGRSVVDFYRSRLSQ
jgi:hypothetical protein